MLDVLADDVGKAAADLGATPVVCDARPADVESVLTATIGDLGGIDVLVNNAGIFRITPLLEDHHRRVGPDVRDQ